MPEASSDVPVLIQGLGPVGQAVARAVAAEPTLALAGAVDPAVAGQPLIAAQGGAASRLHVAASLSDVLRLARGGVLVHTGEGPLAEVLPDIERAVKAGLSVVSLAGELAYPWLRDEAAADALDRLAQAQEVAVVGLGTPGALAFDRLPALLSHLAGPVRHLLAVRVTDAAGASDALRARLGVGLDEEAFHAAADAGRVGFEGLSEAAMLAAAGAGFELDEVEEELVPLLAEEAIQGVARGAAAGLQQTARGFAEGEERVRLELSAAVAAEDPHDEVLLDGRPPLRLRVDGAPAIEEGAALAAVHAAAALLGLRGLVTVLDLPTGR